MPNKKTLIDYKIDYPLSITKEQMNGQNILAYMSIETHKQTQNPHL